MLQSEKLSEVGKAGGQLQRARQEQLHFQWDGGRVETQRGAGVSSGRLKGQLW